MAPEQTPHEPPPTPSREFPRTVGAGLLQRSPARPPAQAPPRARLRRHLPGAEVLHGDPSRSVLQRTLDERAISTYVRLKVECIGRGSEGKMSRSLVAIYGATGH